MTLPAFPRIFVYGQMSWDPSLANNFDIYDTANARLDRTKIPNGVSLEEYRSQLPVQHAQGVEQDGRIRSSWNNYGTHRAVFETVKVTGVSTAPGVIDTDDPIVDTDVRMAGKLVDLNPATDQGTQIFFDRIEIGNAFTQIRADRKRRMTARFLNFGRNLGGLDIAGNASAVWEVSLPADGVSLTNFSGSGGLSAMEAALGDADVKGITFRFHTYRTLYWRNGIDNQSPHQPRGRDDLAALYGAGYNFSNPAYSIICGVIRPWRVDEHEGHPTGRILYTTGGRLGKAFVAIDRDAKAAVLDLGETVPEVDVDLNKLDAGQLVLSAERNGARVELATIAPAEYGRAAYEQTAGFVDIDLSGLTSDQWATLEGGDLSLTAPGHSLEERQMVVVVEDRDHYVDQGDGATIRLKVLDRGHPAAGAQIRAFAFDNMTGAQAAAPVTLTADAAGEVDFIAPPVDPGVRYFVFDAFAVGETPSAPSIEGPGNDFHAYVRTLPNDDDLEAATTNDQLTWSWIYKVIFAEFDVLNPVMSRTSDPAINVPLHDRASMESKAERVKAVIRKEAFEDAGFMPVTRDLSRGRRRLLERWCDLVLSGQAPPERVLIASAMSTRSERVMDAPAANGGSEASET